MKSDYHMHSSFSDDSTCLMEDEVKQAILMGLNEICFTEHVDYGVKTNLNCDYEAYFKELKRCQELYHDKIVIRAGVEFGLQKQTLKQYQDDFKKYDFDFVILSIHQIDNLEFWNYQFQQGKRQEEYVLAYYQALYDMVCQYKDYSVLGHIDMIKRYDIEPLYPDEKIIPIVTKILKQVIQDGKGIEINTSSFKYGLPDLTPSRKILTLYHELGGTIITIGSDCHDCHRVGKDITLVKEELKRLGFKKFCTYEKMMPIYHNL